MAAKVNDESTVKATDKKMVKIKLPRPVDKYEPNFVTASVNGEVFKIQKGVEVEVPDYIAEVLEHVEEAKEAKYNYADSKA